jgi:hypothetical protein
MEAERHAETEKGKCIEEKHRKRDEGEETDGRDRKYIIRCNKMSMFICSSFFWRGGLIILRIRGFLSVSEGEVP